MRIQENYNVAQAGKREGEINIALFSEKLERKSI